jgi:hypothetical protein
MRNTITESIAEVFFCNLLTDLRIRCSDQISISEQQKVRYLNLLSDCINEQQKVRERFSESDCINALHKITSLLIELDCISELQKSIRLLADVDCINLHHKFTIDFKVGISVSVPIEFTAIA